MKADATFPEEKEFSRSIDADRKLLGELLASLQRTNCRIEMSKTLIARSSSLLDRLAVRRVPGIAVAESSQSPGET